MDWLFDYLTYSQMDSRETRILIIGTNISNLPIMSKFKIGYLKNLDIAHYVTESEYIVCYTLKYNIYRKKLIENVKKHGNFNKIYISEGMYSNKLYQWLIHITPNIHIVNETNFLNF